MNSGHEFPKLYTEKHYTVSVEFVVHEKVAKRRVDEAIADAIYNIGGEVVNVGEYEGSESHFGVVRWGEEDIVNALEERGIDPTEKNIGKILDKCRHHNFVDGQIETGWDYINAYIQEEFDK